METKKFSTGLFVVSALLLHGVFGVGSVEVSVREGDSVSLYTGVKTSKQENIKWFFNNTIIAQITGYQSQICTKVQCKERFRDRLKLDHQTGSLTIMNTNSTDSGEYTLWITSNRDSSDSSDSETIFSVDVHAAERDEVKNKSAKKGESVTLDPGVMKNPNDVMKWYFNDTLLAEITGDQSQISTDVLDGRFRDRLKVNQTGSLTITNTRTTDSGLYHLQINSSRFRIIRSFSVSVTGQSVLLLVAVIAGVAVLLVAVIAVVIYYRRTSSRKGGLVKKLLLSKDEMTKGRKIRKSPKWIIEYLQHYSHGCKSAKTHAIC